MSKTLEYWNSRQGHGFSHADGEAIHRIFFNEASERLQDLAYKIAEVRGLGKPAPIDIVMACRLAEDFSLATALCNMIEDQF